jgi:hypothetical protein
MTSAVFDTVLYTVEVINTLSKIALDLGRARERWTGIAVRSIEGEADAVLEEIRLRDEARRSEILEKPGCSPRDRPAVDPAYFQTYQFYQLAKRKFRPHDFHAASAPDRTRPECQRGTSHLRSSKQPGTVLSSAEPEILAAYVKYRLKIYDK